VHRSGRIEFEPNAGPAIEPAPADRDPVEALADVPFENREGTVLGRAGNGPHGHASRMASRLDLKARTDEHANRAARATPATAR